MTLKEVQVSDKETVFNVPVEIPDEDIIEEYNTQNLSSEERRQALLTEIQAKNPNPTIMGLSPETFFTIADYAGVGPGAEEKSKDQLKTIVSQGVNAYDTGLRLFKKVFTDDLETPEQKQKFFADIKKLKPDIYKAVVEAFGKTLKDAEVQEAFDEQGNPVVTYKIAALGTEAVPYILPAAAAAKVSSALGKGATFLGGEILLSQFLTGRNNVEDSLTGEAVNYFPKLQQIENDVIKVLNTVGINPGDESIARFKLGIDTAGLAAFFAVPDVIKYVKNLGVKPEELLDVDEQKNIAIQYLKDNYQRAVNMTDVKGSGIINRTIAGIRRQVAQYLTSKGFFDKKTFETKQRTIGELKGNLSRAGELSTKLDQELNLIASESSTKGEKVKQLVTKALTEGINIAEYSADNISVDVFKKALQNKDEFKEIPENILDLIADARVTIDKYSAEIAASKTFARGRDDLIDNITGNVGAYLTRSYRLHQGDWTPSKVIQEDTIKYFTNLFQKKNPNDSLAVSAREAREAVDKILQSSAVVSPSGTVNFETLSAISQGLLKGKKDVPPEIRRLLGEIEDPSAVVLNTLAKVSTLVSQTRFLDDFYENNTALGLLKPSKYEPTGADEQIFNYKIEGTNSKLDGMYTTPEIGIALQDRETALLPIIGATFTDKATEGGAFLAWGRNNIVASLAAAKGFSQKLKTVWNLTSHTRNIAGGLILVTSQGHNPFRKEALDAFKTAAQKGDKFYTDLHNKLLDLGILDTNTRISEFREILNEYRTIAEAGENASLSAERMVNFLNNKGLKKIGTEKYNVGNALQNVDQALQSFYVGTDDFYKTFLFLREREVLKKAFPNLSDQGLDTETAKIVRDIYPNYNRVPKGIKSLRNIPIFGAFVSFPAEIVRTTVNTFDRAANEIASGNPTLMARGAQRLASVSAIGLGGSYATEKATSASIGWTEDQLKAFKELYGVDYGPQSYAFTKDKDGNIYSHNLTYTDPRNNIVAPIRAAFQEFEKGKITKEAYDNKVIDIVYEAAKEFVSPYISETVLNQASLNFYSTLAEGRRSQGGVAVEEFFEEQGGGIGNLDEAFVNFLYDAGPGFLRTVKRAKDVLIDEDSAGLFNESADKSLFLTSLATTLTAEKVDMPKQLEKVTKLYTIKMNQLTSPLAYKADNIEEYISAVVSVNEEIKKESQKYYLKLKAYETFYGSSVQGRQSSRQYLDMLRSKYGENVNLVSLGISPSINLSPSTLRKQMERLVDENKVPLNYFEFSNYIKDINPNLTPGGLDLAPGLEDKIILKRESTRRTRENKSEGGVISDKLTENTNLNFVKRILNPALTLKNEDGTTSTHLMTSSNVEGLEYVYPLIVEKTPGKLTKLSPEEAFKYALETGEYITFEDPTEGRAFAKEDYKKGTRLDKAVGGEIDTIGAEVLVPNTPIEPDGRIDKMTGLPYNVQAGIPFIDEQDPLKRLGLVGGGRVTSDPIQRLGFATGGKGKLFVELGKAALEKVEDTVEVSADIFNNAFKYVLDVADEEVPQMSKNIEAPTVYHQSDAEFDTFSMEKIGTGQGNQAEGHGIFLSSKENPGTFYGKNQYEATLNLAEDKMLDYDLPLKDQSEYVKNALLKIDDDPALSRIVSQATLGLQNTMKELIEGGRTTGESLTNSFRTELRGADKVSELLNKLGIKATKYVTKEIGRQGTKSYVVFDPSVLKITSKTATKQQGVDDVVTIPKSDAEIANKMTEKDIAAWQKANKLPESKRQKQKPEVIRSLQQVLEGKKSIAAHNKLVDEEFPPVIYTKENAPEFPTLVEVKGAVGKKTLTGGRGIIDADVFVDEGLRVSSRLDIPAYDQRGVWAVTLHEPGKSGKAFAYGQSAILKNVEFTTDPKDALDIAMGQAKGTIARIEGNWVNHNSTETYTKALELLDSDEWVQVGMNPYKHSYFYDKATMKPLKSASEVIQVGPLVLAKKDKNLIYADADDFKVDLSPENIKGKKKLRDQTINIDNVSFMEGGMV